MFELTHDEARLLRDHLAKVGYTVEGVREQLGPVAHAALHRNETTAGLRATSDMSPLSTLIRLWLLQVPVPRQRAATALPDLLQPLVDAGILHCYGNDVCALADIRPYGVAGEVPAVRDDIAHSHAHTGEVPGAGLFGQADADMWVVADLTPGMDGVRPTVPPEHVLGVNSAATTLAQLTVRRPIARALDIGTGCGVQALHLTSHVDHVVGTDINPRALAMARLTAQLNGIPLRASAPSSSGHALAAGVSSGQASGDHAPSEHGSSGHVSGGDPSTDHGSIDDVLGDSASSTDGRSAELELRTGSLFEPVDGETFDLIVSNPPFVISPRGGLIYRDSGLAGDAVCRQIVVEAAGHLADGGVCQILANWLHVRGEDWRDRLAGWLLRTGCDAWVVQREVSDPAEYIEVWLKDAGLHGAPGYRERYDEWLGWFEAQQVEAIGYGWITLRKQAAGSAPHHRVEEWTSTVAQPLGAEVARWLDAVDLLRSYDDNQLADAQLRVAAYVDQEQLGRPGAADPEHIVLRLRSGLCRAVVVDTAEAGFIGACDGTLTVRAIIGALATLLDEDEDDLRVRLLPRIRQFVEEGYISLQG